MPKVITIGEILVEIMTKNKNQEFLKPGELIGPYPSGAPAIFIDQVQRMGISSGIISKIGNDEFGILNKNRLYNDGVDVSNIKIVDEYTTGTAFVTYFEDGSRKFIFHLGHSASGYLNEDDISEDYIKQAEFLHIMGCSVSGSEGMRRAILKGVEIAKKHGVKISFDPNIRVELLTRQEIKEAYDYIISSCEVLLPGEDEIKALTGIQDVEKSVEIFLNKGINIIAVKNGSKGSTVYTKELKLKVPSLDVIEIDPTGAGDCYDGAFIASLVDGKDLENAARIANVAGALAVTKKGPMEGVHFKEDIMSLL
ncbi:MAG: PfkB protein [Thermoanaerobacter sp.]|jgi:sugar/nucleoside kinase (ribokinase family)|nr:PfkB protein [Thermoanaerobacter sp.]